MNERSVWTTEEINDGLVDIKDKLLMRLAEKGYHSFSSRHEILGIIIEELDELIYATKSNIGIEDELLDIAVGAILGYISVKNGKVDW